MTMKFCSGNRNVSGRSVNSPLYIVMMNPIRVPTMSPIRLLVNTKTKASYLQILIIKALVIPRALYTVISFVCSQMLAVMADTRLKQHSSITMQVMVLNRMSTTFSCYYMLCSKSFMSLIMKSSPLSLWNFCSFSFTILLFSALLSFNLNNILERGRLDKLFIFYQFLKLANQTKVGMLKRIG